MPAPIVLLGPQRLRPTLASALADLGVTGTVAAVTAGWEEREEEIDELSEHVGRRVVNLRLHGRTEEAFLRDPAFLEAYLARRRRLRELRDLYCRRLTHHLQALLELLALGGTADLLREHRISALEAVRCLDEEHLGNMTAEYESFEAVWADRPGGPLADHRAQVAEVLGASAAVAIAGGNVEALVHRLRLFGLGPRLARMPVLAWSAGAMALAGRVVLYHDTPPQGMGYPEMFGPGIGLFQGVLPLPHAHRRLRLDDSQRVRLFVRRFAPQRCLVLADGARATLRPDLTWELDEGVDVLADPEPAREPAA